MQGGRRKTFSQLAIQRWAAGGRRSLVRGSGRADGMHPVVTDSADNLQDGSPERNSQAAGKIVNYIFWVIAILSVAGIGVSAVSLQRHYAKSATSFCEFGEKFNCDIVNRSEYSEVMGIPVAGIGVVGYGVLFALSTFYRA